MTTGRINQVSTRAVGAGWPARAVSPRRRCASHIRARSRRRPAHMHLTCAPGQRPLPTRASGSAAAHRQPARSVLLAPTLAGVPTHAVDPAGRSANIPSLRAQPEARRSRSCDRAHQFNDPVAMPRDDCQSRGSERRAAALRCFEAAPPALPAPFDGATESRAAPSDNRSRTIRRRARA